jgi:hypothetical protein
MRIGDDVTQPVQLVCRCEKNIQVEVYSYVATSSYPFVPYASTGVSTDLLFRKL